MGRYYPPLLTNRHLLQPPAPLSSFLGITRSVQERGCPARPTPEETKVNTASPPLVGKPHTYKATSSQPSPAQKHPIDRKMNVSFQTCAVQKHRAQVERRLQIKHLFAIGDRCPCFAQIAAHTSAGTKPLLARSLSCKPENRPAGRSL